jgi:predicted nucleic acid-binding protein
MILVLNSTPLIYLAKVNVLELLEKLPERKVIPTAVYREVVVNGKKRGAPDAFLIEKAINEGIFVIKEARDKKLLKTLARIPGLHKADIEVLALTRELNATAIVDEDKARGVADVNDVQNRGTGYLLIRLVKLGLLTKKEAKAKVDEMVKLGWRCSTEVYAEILKSVTG